MKTKILIFLALVLAFSTPLVPQASAIDFSISVGDRPYYHGAGYWHQGYYWVWVPGHYSHRRGGGGPRAYLDPGAPKLPYSPPPFPPPPRWGRGDRRSTPAPPGN